MPRTDKTADAALPEETAAPEAPPQLLDIHSTPIATALRARVVDAATGDELLAIIRADATEGKVLRYQVDDEGNLVREDNRFVTVEEERAIRIEWRPEEPA